jgi:hypothetical protein
MTKITISSRRELSRPIEEDVDRYLERGIEAINKEAWKNEYCNKYSLVFKDKRMEHKVTFLSTI